MNIERIEQGPRFSEAVVVELGQAKLIFVSGQVAQDTSLDITGQTRQVLSYIEQILAQAGADKSDIVQARIYLRSVGDYVAMNSVWDDWVVGGRTPARATVGAKLINLDYKIEIECVAAVGNVGPSCGPLGVAQGL